LGCVPGLRDRCGAVYSFTRSDLTLSVTTREKGVKLPEYTYFPGQVTLATSVNLR